MSTQQVENAARQALGSVPSSWDVRRISDRLERIKPLNEQPILELDPTLVPPPATYVLWLLRAKGMSFVYYTNAIVADANISEFERNYEELAEDAKLLSELDVANFVAELEVSSIDVLMERSCLAISPLYKYIAAQERSLEFLLTDDMILRAIKELRANPYLFFTYGKSAQSLMPVLWGDL